MRILILVQVLLLTLYSCRQPLYRESDSPPNFIIIMADDLGFSDIGCYGSEIHTPNLDNLAARGIRFTQFYNAARCCPTRASLLTGLYPHQVGMGSMVAHSGNRRPDGPYQGYLRTDSCMTIAEALDPASYQSYMSGKWHVGESPEHWPSQRGFDKYWGLISGASSYFELIKDQPRDRVMALNNERWEPPPKGFYMTDAITDYAVQCLADHQREYKDEPFFLYVAYTAPHWPLHALPEDIVRYDGIYDIGWDSLRKQRHARQVDQKLFHGHREISPRPASIPAWEDAVDHT
ncbi:MAG: sulfatase-like hydrolase/transferase, partial [Saprospiraceae bacterium]|nr:sulfatase-like hydrolase/transferase [Saprospiraceae bacterium]